MSKKEINNSRRGFIKKGMAGLAGAAVLPSVLRGQEEKKTKPAGGKRPFIFRQLGKTGLKLPIVSMGAQTYDMKLIQTALDAGITHLDTSSHYRNGNHEILTGKAIKGRPRDSVIVATSTSGGGDYDNKTGLFKKIVTTEYFIKKVEDCLKRLDTDYIDILYVPGISRRESALYPPIIKGMETLKKQGKIRFGGIATHMNEPEAIRAAVESKFYDVVLAAYNFKQPHYLEVKKEIARAAKAGIGIVAMKTQAGVYWDRERKNMINMKAALKWALRDENVHTSVPGFSNFEQMEVALSAMENTTLTPQEEKDLKLGEKTAFNGLYCAQCGKCREQCAASLEIPLLMRSYMYAYGYHRPGKARETLQHLAENNMTCLDCGNCRVTCTMGFDVKQKVRDIARLRDVPEEFLV